MTAEAPDARERCCELLAEIDALLAEIEDGDKREPWQRPADWWRDDRET